MASPQTENGYSKIANELLEAIYQTSFNATQLKIILFVMRYTFGFSRKQFKISVNFISKGTGISKRYISSELNKLIESNVVKIVKNHTVTESRIIEINKNYENWKMSRTVLHQMNSSSPDEVLFTTGDEEYFTGGGEEIFSTPGEELFIQDKQNIKQNIKQCAPSLFELFWKAYPKKNAKASAEKAFKRLNVNEKLLSRMLSALEIQKKSKQWQDIQFIPYPATWLNQKRWEDESEEPKNEVDFVQNGTMLQLR